MDESKSATIRIIRNIADKDEGIRWLAHVKELLVNLTGVSIHSVINDRLEESEIIEQ